MTERRNKLSGWMMLLFIIILMMLFSFPSLFSTEDWTGIKSEQSDKITLEEYYPFKYIEKFSGEDLTLQCPRPKGSFVHWSYPKGADMTDKRYNQITFQPEDQYSKFHIQNLQINDTGEYSCRVKEAKLRDTIYLYVKGEKTFLLNKDLELTVKLKEFHVPCRTSSPIQREKIKLFIDDKEWSEVCTIGKNFVNPSEVRQLKKHNQTDQLRCINVWKNYNPSEGFFITSSEIPFRWSQVNNKRFRCEYEGESVEFLIRATQSFPDFKGQTATVECVLPNKQTLLLDGRKNRLELSCFQCDSNSKQSNIERIFERFDDLQILEEITTLWNLSNENTTNFCDCIQQIGGFGQNCTSSDFIEGVSKLKLEPKPSGPPKSLFDLIMITLAGVLLLLLILSPVIFVIFYIGKSWKKKRASKEKAQQQLPLLDGEMAPPQTPLQIQVAENLPQTFEERSVGVGGFGRVVELIGYDPPAVKKYLKKKSFVEAQNDLKSFTQEFEILKTLKHRNVVSLIEMKSIEGSNDFGIVMEYCQRGNLEELFFNPTMIYTMKTVIVWGDQLFDALDYMYSRQSLVHRDIKPENIFVTSDFVLKIGDFGLAKHIESSCVGSFVGTQRYMSPTWAQESNNLEDFHRNDVYALGLVLWQIVERRLVFLEYGAKNDFNLSLFLSDIIRKNFKELVAPNCQGQFCEIIKRCTNFNCQARPLAREICEEIERINQVINQLEACKKLLQTDRFISTLDLMPIEEKEQREIIRPIGFNGAMNRVSIVSDYSVRSDDLITHYISFSIKENSVYRN